MLPKVTKEQRQLLIWSLQMAIADLQRELLLSHCKHAIEKQIEEMEKLIKLLKAMK